MSYKPSMTIEAAVLRSTINTWAAGILNALYPYRADL